MSDETKVSPALVRRESSGWYEVLYAALQPLCCGGSSTLIDNNSCTTFLRRWRRKRGQFQRRRWRRLSRRFIGRIQSLFFQQFRSQSQFRRWFQFECALERA
jgi:hypothetical protein